MSEIWFVPDRRGTAKQTHYPDVTFTEQQACEVGVFAGEIMRLIDADIEAGVVPADVASFAELHNYVDANMYVVEAAVPYSTATRDGMAFVNAVDDEVDRRLAARSTPERRAEAW